MKAFDQLHPALQHHIVNSLRWSELRPLQEQSISSILDGDHTLLIAPTAGGKTEAAILPILSRMLRDEWSGLSVLYLCPIKALLNNLQDRLAFYSNLVGRRCAVWHGDIKEGERKAIRKEPPDILLTTPESLEAMLISSRTEHSEFFSSLQTVVVDEIHAFAGDERGWHLIAVLERIARCAGRDIQRIGLSATVGNPDQLVEWLAGKSTGKRVVLNPPSSNSQDADVQLDYVGSLENAATVISRLHRGQKRLVYCDSRARVEKLTNLLRQSSTDTYVSHSSLSAEERRRAEQAFSEARDCVIVATSALELGIDVGDLDRVIQIDAPSTVSSFLQRMGRTGRRSKTQRNCLFLATSDQALLQAASLLSLWEQGFVEPVEPPPKPYHLLAQQVLAMLLQERANDMHSLVSWLAALPPFKDTGQEAIRKVLEHMLETEILAQDQGVLWFGSKGEKAYGFRNFINLSSIFDTPPMFSVRYGRTDLGYVDEITFHRSNKSQVLLLSGRSWLVKSIDWMKRIVHVKPTQLEGRSQWSGAGPMLSYPMCQAIRATLVSEEIDLRWSKRAVDAMESLRTEYAWVSDNGNLLIQRGDYVEIWTFAGMKVNNTLALLVQSATGFKTSPQNLQIRIESSDIGVISMGMKTISEKSLLTAKCCQFVNREWAKPKFCECLPVDMIQELYTGRFTDFPTARSVLASQARLVICNL